MTPEARKAVLDEIIELLHRLKETEAPFTVEITSPAARVSVAVAETPSDG